MRGVLVLNINYLARKIGKQGVAKKGGVRMTENSFCLKTNEKNN